MENSQLLGVAQPAFQRGAAGSQAGPAAFWEPAQRTPSSSPWPRTASTRSLAPKGRAAGAGTEGRRAAGPVRCPPADGWAATELHELVLEEGTGRTLPGRVLFLSTLFLHETNLD